MAKKSAGIVFGAQIKGGEELLRKLKKLQIDIPAALEEAARDGAEEILAAANDMAPGPYLEIVTKEVKKDQVTVNIKPDKEHWYYMFFESGVTPHEIKARRGKALRTGEGLFFRRVQHSGFPAKPFLRPAFDAKRHAAEKRFASRLREIIKRAERGEV